MVLLFDRVSRWKHHDLFILNIRESEMGIIKITFTISNQSNFMTTKCHFSITRYNFIHCSIYRVRTEDITVNINLIVVAFIRSHNRGHNKFEIPCSDWWGYAIISHGYLFVWLPILEGTWSHQLSTIPSRSTIGAITNYSAIISSKNIRPQIEFYACRQLNGQYVVLEYHPLKQLLRPANRHPLLYKLILMPTKVNLT